MLKRLLVIALIYMSYVTCWPELTCTKVINPAKEEDCTVIYPIENKPDYRCCHVYYKVGDTEIKECKVYPYDNKKLAIIEETTYLNVKSLDIQCSGSYIFASAIIILAVIF